MRDTDVTEQAIAIGKIRTDGGTQPRAELRQDVVDDYAERFDAGDNFPPVDVFYDGTDYWLADGFHRYHGASKAGLVKLLANVHQGTQREAVLFSVSANISNGLRRSNQDKRRAVETLLRDKEWRKWTDREIAKRCAVCADLVGDIRRSLSVSDSEPRKYTTKHGTESTMRTDRINAGRKPKAEPEEVVEVVDTSTGEVHDPKDLEVVTTRREPIVKCPKIALELPKDNPDSAARTLLSFFDRDFIKSMIDRLMVLMQGEME